MFLISPGGENRLDFLELRQVLSTYDGDLRDPLLWPQERPVPLRIDFLPRSKHLFISWLQSPSAVILEPKKINFLTVSIVSPSICHEVMGPDGMILVF